MASNNALTEAVAAARRYLRRAAAAGDPRARDTLDRIAALLAPPPSPGQISMLDDHTTIPWAEWEALADDAIRALAHRGVPFTSDDVWAMIAARPVGRDPRVLGCILLRARRDGLITKTDRAAPSRRRAAHRNPKTIWRQA